MVHLIAIAGLCVAAMACGAKSHSPKPTPGPAVVGQAGSVVIVKAERAVNDRGTLTLVSLSDGTEKSLLSEAPRRGQVSVTLQRDALFAVRYRQPDRTKQATSSIVEVALSSGDVREITSGSGLAVSDTGDLAYCDAGHVFVRSERGDLADLGRAFVTDGCGVLAWSHDGRLAFSGSLPLGARPPIPTDRVYIREIDGTIQQVRVGEELRGEGLSWSPDGNSLAFAVVGTDIVIRTIATGATSLRVRGDVAAFNPHDATQIAVLARDHTTGVVDLVVYKDGKPLAHRDLGHLLNGAFDWSPSGDAIAITIDQSVGVWNPATDAFRLIKVVGVGEQLFDNIRWVTDK